MKLLPAMPSTRTMLRAVAATLAASVAGVVLGGALTVRPDHMLVEHVRFEGHDEAGAAELRHLLDLRNGTRVWEVDAEALAARAARVMRLAVRLESAQGVNRDLLQAMRSRTVINVATGILMAQSRCSQSEAFELLAKVSNNRNVKLRIVAEEILRRFDGAPAGTAFSA